MWLFHILISHFGDEDNGQSEVIQKRFWQRILQGIFKNYIAFDYRKLLLFAKIMQSFILMQNT